MTKKSTIKTGSEADATSRKSRRIVKFARGELKKLKRSMSKRERTQALGAIAESVRSD